jgi:hypothetical protein
MHAKTTHSAISDSSWPALPYSDSPAKSARIGGRHAKQFIDNDESVTLRKWLVGGEAFNLDQHDVIDDLANVGAAF